MLIGLLALTTAALFTGVAFYISFAEQPARLVLEDQPLLAVWKIAYRRGFALQAPLAALGFLFGFLAWFVLDSGVFLIGSLLMLANWPWTLIALSPTNNALLNTDPLEAGPEVRALTVKWSKLHQVRTILGGLALLCFLLGLSVQ
jgi:hypothetical protein